MSRFLTWVAYLAGLIILVGLAIIVADFAIAYTLIMARSFVGQ